MLKVARCKSNTRLLLLIHELTVRRSKSLGNVLDPVDVMDGITLDQLQEKLKLGNLDEKEYDIASKTQRESFPQGIPECGADALRFSLINYTTGGMFQSRMTNVF
jgi:valyl-tRNA synthetase